MQIQKLSGFKRIYQAECFPDEVHKMLGKNTGEKKRYIKWLYTWLSVLDNEGMNSLNYQQFEHLKGTSNPRLYAIRHSNSNINERYIFVFSYEESTILLTSFKEKNSNDYLSAITRAINIYADLEG